MTTKAMKRQAEPKERPIMFSDEMVRAVLDGRKTQTRRVMKPQPEPPGPSHWYFHEPGNWWTCGNNSGQTWTCPFGRPGDRLWFKETYSGGYTVRHENGERIKVPRFIPRNLSRITLEITNVRVERLQDISEEDARAEGYEYKQLHAMHEEAAGMSLMTMPDDPRLWFRTRWEQIHGKRHPWESNPFCWVIEYEKLEEK